MEIPRTLKIVDDVTCVRMHTANKFRAQSVPQDKQEKREAEHRKPIWKIMYVVRADGALLESAWHDFSTICVKEFGPSSVSGARQRKREWP